MVDSPLFWNIRLESELLLSRLIVSNSLDYFPFFWGMRTVAKFSGLSPVLLNPLGIRLWSIVLLWFSDSFSGWLCLIALVGERISSYSKEGFLLASGDYWKNNCLGLTFNCPFIFFAKASSLFLKIILNFLSSSFLSEASVFSFLLDSKLKLIFPFAMVYFDKSSSG